jgi:hypothetical protein
MVTASMNERWKVEIEASSKKFYQLRFAETIYAPGPILKLLKLKRVQCSETMDQEIILLTAGSVNSWPCSSARGRL